MPQKFENLRPKWDNIDDECQHLPLNCPWTITSANETLTVVISCLEWTFNYVFWIRVTAHPEGTHIFRNKQILISMTRCLNLYQKPSTITKIFLSPFELLSTSYSWRTTRLATLKEYIIHNGQNSSCLS